MSKNNQKLEVISINQIDVSKTNPRKHFDENALRELAQSIKEHGILQPILVRPMNDKEEGFEQFELVCGERRYRAAILAGLEDIPVNIRVLTDDEAFELQIVENLERKDVHPLDEADAFKKMLDSGKYTIADVAAKMAKSESFIAQRLKLVDLIDDVRTDFIAGHLGIGHAILIARCDEYKQLDIYKEAQPYREGLPNYGTIAEMKDTIEEDTYDLSLASFDKEDKTLIPECGSCTACPNRSGFNPVLFEDMQDVDRCFNQKCFDKKELAHFQKQVAKIITEAENVVLVSGYTKPDDFVLQMCKHFDVKIFGYNDWFAGEREDTTEATAYFISGSDIGKYKQVWIKTEQSVDGDTPTIGTKTPISNEEIEIKEEIAKIEARQKRALELDNEKVWAEIRAIDPILAKQDTDKLCMAETEAVAIAMIKEMSYYAKDKLLKELDIRIDLDFVENGKFTEEQLNIIHRRFALDILPESFGSHKTDPKFMAYKTMVGLYYYDQVEAIEKAQNDIAQTRISKANAKIKELKSKIEKLQPAEEPKKEAPERIEDTVEIKHFSSDIKQFDKVDKKYALNNSYFKNRKNTYPANPLEVAMYHEQHGTLPFDYSGTNWLYETYIEYQKRNSVYHSQYFTPPATALRIASLADKYFVDPKGEANGRPWVMDMCCGFGMLSKPIRELGFIVRGFDFSHEMIDLYNFSQECIAELCNFETDHVELYDYVVANPPYEVPKLTKLFERLHSDFLADNGKAIILLPKGFMLKEKPKALVEILEKFNIIHSEDMTEDFAHTKIKAEIVVLEKA